MVEKSYTAGWLPSISEPLHHLGQGVADWFAPKAEASSIDNAYEIVVELPGVKPENVDIGLSGNSLTIRGEKQFEREETGRRYFFSELEYGVFERTFRLPDDADTSGIQASFADGVMKIIVPHKSQEKHAEIKVPIRYQFGATRK